MTENFPSIGTPEWIEAVFASGPVRNIKGRSKMTHRHLIWLFTLKRLAYLESRNELMGALALEYLTQLGSVLHFKEQPFTTNSEIWTGMNADDIPSSGIRGYTPDFFAIGQSNKKYIIEIKAARFITREMERDFELWKHRLEELGFKFLLWTDRKGLTGHLRSNLLRMRRSSLLQYESDELPRFLELLNKNGEMPLWALYNFDIDIDLIGMAAWKGLVYFPLHNPLSGVTKISLKPCHAVSEQLLEISPDMFSWWNQLKSA